MHPRTRLSPAGAGYSLAVGPNGSEGRGQAIRIPLPPDKWATRVARDEARQAMAALVWDHRVPDVVLLVSELVTNAVDQAAADIELLIDVRDGTLRIEVCDSGGGRPVRRALRPTDIRGRGLNIVASLSDAWGTRVGPGQTVVWCEIRR